MRKDELEYFREVGLHDTVTVTYALLAMSANGARFVVENEVWGGGGERAARVRSTGGWLDLRARKLIAPPPELFAHVRPGKAIFNLGAGVEVLLATATLPEGIPVIRLENAGMAAQMAEYVTLAVLRAFRESDAYAAQQREARWQPRPRLAKSAFGVGILGFGVLGQVVARSHRLRFRFARGARRARRFRASSRSRGRPVHSFLAASRVLVCLLPSTPATRASSITRICPGCRVALMSSTSPGEISSWTRISSRCSTAATSRAPRSTCFAPNRCPPGIRSGIIRGSF
jgi:hypothetical protein